PADLAAQYAFALQIHDHIDTLVSAVERVQQAESQLASWTDWTKNRPEGARVKAQADSLRRSLEAVRGRLSEPHAHADESTLHWPIQIYNQLLSLNAMVQSADAAPTRQEREVLAELSGRLDKELAALRGIEMGDLAAFNRLLRDLNVPAVGAGLRVRAARTRGHRPRGDDQVRDPEPDLDLGRAGHRHGHPRAARRGAIAPSHRSPLGRPLKARAERIPGPGAGESAGDQRAH